MMKAQDCSLGMHRKIKQRDFVNGISATVAGAFLLPQIAAAQEFARSRRPTTILQP